MTAMKRRDTTGGGRDSRRAAQGTQSLERSVATQNSPDIQPVRAVKPRRAHDTGLPRIEVRPYK